MPKNKSKGFYSRERDDHLEDLRDDCIAVALNSKLSFQEIHARGGPTTQTISKWLYKETQFPRLGTVRSILKACGHDLTVAPTGDPRIQRIGYQGISMPPKEAKRGKKAVKALEKIKDRRAARREKILSKKK